MQKLIITAAINGGITPRSKNPHVPYTPQEIADSAYQAWQAGASIAHIHARDVHGKPSYEFEVWQEIFTLIRERCDMLINFSTSGFNLPANEPEEKAWNHLVLRPDIGSFNCGSVNHGSKPFINKPETAKKLALELKKYQVKPEVEVYHSGVINEANSLIEQGYLDPSSVFSFAMGIHGGVTATCKNLLNLVDNLPHHNPWSVIGIGAAQLPINLHAMLLGGHVRTGLEDNVYYRKGQLASGNAQLVDRLARFAYEIGRDIASPQEAKAILGIAETNISTESVLAAS